MKYYFISGERSGDLHASNLIRAIKALDSKATFRGMGGDYSQNEGLSLCTHYNEVALMGFVEVLLGFRKVLKFLSLIKKDILKFKPDVLVLIDYPGFNLRIAKWAKENNINVIYYISPQVWAWKENRVKMMKQCIDEMLVILPFEKGYYKNKWNWEVQYVGHPLIEELESRLTRWS